MARRMLLMENVLAFGTLDLEREAREAGLMTGFWVP